MATATERVPVLMTGREKAEIARKARQAGLSMGEFLRRAARSYRPAEDDKALEGMIKQMILSTERAQQALDEALAFIEASNRRIAAMEKRHGAKRKATR
jgi:ribosomal protein L13